MGKHFRICEVNNQSLSRHYTICNVMQPVVYQAYLKAIRSGNRFEKIDENCLKTDARDTCSFTIKNYDQAGGLSQKFYRGGGFDLYSIIGPIGKGLCHSNQGTHIAFAAGTGVLIFMDFVAFAARKALGYSNIQINSSNSDFNSDRGSVDLDKSF